MSHRPPSDPPVVSESSAPLDVPSVRPESNHRCDAPPVDHDRVLVGVRNVPVDCQSQSILSDDGDDAMHSDASEDPHDADNEYGLDLAVRREKDPGLPLDLAVELTKRKGESLLPYTQKITEAARVLNQKRRKRNKKNKR